MNNIKLWLVVFIFSGLSVAVNAKNYVVDGAANPTNNSGSSATASLRANCAEATSQTDLSINNVRARLLNGGDMWWDFDNGRYIVPNVPAGQTAVSSLYAGAVWLGGFDDGGNLKLAAQTYRSNGNDYWPGPLDANNGGITDEECSRWDVHFTVYGADIYQHIANFNSDDFDCDAVVESLKRWPGRGNPHFADYYGWELPNQALAPFYDEDNDGEYDPCQGDFPIIEVRGCAPGTRNGASIADQMTFWVYNDNGNIHTQTTGDPIRMEIQAQAFAYATSDEVNEMTFYRYKLVNRANSPIDSTYFTMWVDGDLGCHLDDYIGSDTTRSLGIYYNQNAVDGSGGCSGTPSYGDNPPMLGIDYFRGPLDENGIEIGMSSFTYYINGGQAPNPGMSDPNNAVEYYNYMTGTWRDGTQFTVGGNGYGGVTPTKYVYVEDPTVTGGNSMCQQNLSGTDVRTLQSSGPFRLDPGAVNELIIGVAWVPNIIDYPCPSFTKLITADDLAQALFDNCFKITDGPDAPNMDIIEMDKELVIVLSNDELLSNNAKLGYRETDLQAPLGTQDSVYLFEGYKIYQVASPSVSVSELDDPEKGRLVYQADFNNGVGKIFNWEAYEDSDVSPTQVYVPSLKVDGGDNGIQHSFRITEDQFAQSDRALVNHKKYYFVAVAYAYNNYGDYDLVTNIGQRKAYLQGRRNLGSDGLGTPYVGIPRITAPEYAGLELNATYGDGPSITRLDGTGTGNNFLDITPETEQKIFDNNEEDVLVYTNGKGPIDIKIVDPLRVKGGTYNLTIIDEDLSNTTLDDTVRWVLTDDASEQWFSDVTLDVTNEQVILDRGISVSVGQVNEPGGDLFAPNGFIGASAVYDGDSEAWFGGAGPSDFSFEGVPFFPTILNYTLTGTDVDTDIDPDNVYSNILEGAWVPYRICNWRAVDPSGVAYDPYLTPAWINSLGNLIQLGNELPNLNNVDIVFSPNPDDWTRCPVVETANEWHEAAGWVSQDGVEQMGLRSGASLGKDGQPDGDGTGMSWFPGYAIDVETGERLNLFFGENSIYDGQLLAADNGADMVWNPSNVRLEDMGNNGADNIAELVMGGQHYIYVTNQKYDQGVDLRAKLGSNVPFQVVNALRSVQWVSFPVLPTGVSLKSMAEGIVPSKFKVQLRVNDAYDVTSGDGRSHPNNGYPQYEFNLDEFKPNVGVQEVAVEALDLINVVPNPYYAYSAYETRRFDNIVKVTNLPAKCTVTIYSLDGKFIRQYKRDENPGVNSGALEEQIVTSLEWDLKNSKGISISAGIYLIHVDVPGVGERVIKWFGVNRTFDSQDL